MPSKRIASAFADDDDWRDPLWRRRAQQDAMLRRIEAELLHLQMRRDRDALRRQLEQMTVKLDQMTAHMREQLWLLEALQARTERLERERDEEGQSGEGGKG